VTGDRLAEELRAPARKFFGVQLSEGGLVRRNSKSRISFNRRYRKFAWVFGSTAIVISLLSNPEARDKELHQTALENTLFAMLNQRVPYQRINGWHEVK
jgi:hypothetical protein